MRRPRILFYDIETTPLQAYVWSLGKQVVRHGQLKKDSNMYKIICVTYCWNDAKDAKALVWDYRNQDCAKLIERFDKVIDTADWTIGKNSDRFDVKQLNSQRMLYNLPGKSDWGLYTDDLEKQLRKHFYLPSYSLDYISELLGLGGKKKMEFQDWIDIVEQNSKGREKQAKMVEYGIKDVEDTRALWYYLEKHFKPRFNYATFSDDQVCVVCGSENIFKNGTRVSGQTRYQRYYCNDHGGPAGRRAMSRTGKEGKMS